MSPQFPAAVTCVDCANEIDGQPKQLQVRDGPPRWYCAGCFSAYRERLENARAKRLLEAELQKVLDQLPAFRPRVGTPEFERAVPHPKLRTLAEKYTIDRGHLLIFGPSGEGKTTTVTAIVQRIESEVLAANAGPGCLKSFLWTTGSDLAHAYRNWPLGSEPKLIVAAKVASLLVLDEVGYELISDNILFQVVDERYSRCRPTAVTTGLTRDAFVARYGAACDRRLTEEGIGTPIEIPPKQKGQLNLVKQ